MAAGDQKLRIVLLGKTGTGKSRTGNTILGINNGSKDQFQFACKGDSVTKNCRDKTVTRFGREIRVIDTPGVFDPHQSLANSEIQDEIKKSIILTYPGPHAIVLTVRLGRFTEEDVQTLKHYVRYFGVEILRYVVVIFTHYDCWAGDYIDQCEEIPSLNEYFEKIPDYLQFFLKYCDQRYVAFDNRNNADDSQVEKFISVVDKMIEKNGQNYYTDEIYRKAAEIMERFSDRREIEKRMREKWFPLFDAIKLWLHEIPSTHPLYSLLEDSAVKLIN